MIARHVVLIVIVALVVVVEAALIVMIGHLVVTVMIARHVVLIVIVALVVVAVAVLIVTIARLAVIVMIAQPADSTAMIVQPADSTAMIARLAATVMIVQPADSTAMIAHLAVTVMIGQRVALGVMTDLQRDRVAMMTDLHASIGMIARHVVLIVMIARLAVIVMIAQLAGLIVMIARLVAIVMSVPLAGLIVTTGRRVVVSTATIADHAHLAQRHKNVRKKSSGALVVDAQAERCQRLRSVHVKSGLTKAQPDLFVAPRAFEPRELVVHKKADAKKCVRSIQWSMSLKKRLVVADLRVPSSATRLHCRHLKLTGTKTLAKS
jgi:hypothetical protein